MCEYTRTERSFAICFWTDAGGLIGGNARNLPERHLLIRMDEKVWHVGCGRNGSAIQNIKLLAALHMQRL